MFDTRHHLEPSLLRTDQIIGRKNVIGEVDRHPDMYSVWTYPWSVYEEGPDKTFYDLDDRGVDAVNLASHYHSIRAFQPRFPDSLFVEYPAGCYFNPDPERFAGTPIDPIQNEINGVDDPLGTAVDVADEYGIDVHAWMVCFHNTQLAAENPEYRIQSAFGDAHDHAFCPSNPEVREYFQAVAEALDARGVAEIQIESLNYQSAFHDHGLQHGHDKGQVDLTNTESTLLSQCFCDACRTEARDRGIDLMAAQDRIHNILSDTLRDPTVDPLSLGDLVREHPELGDLFDFRCDIITDLAKEMSARLSDARLSSYVGGVDPDDRWPSGVRLTELDDVLDRMMALCYVSDPNEARDRIRTLRRTVSCPVDAGTTIDPGVVDRREQFLSLINAIDDEDVGQLAVYNHGFMTEEHLDWLSKAFT